MKSAAAARRRNNIEMGETHHGMHVAVIGGGAAGLAATRTLLDANVRVSLIEARDRLGGRAWSIDVPGLEIPAEIGAEFIHGTPEVTLRWLREANIARVDTSDVSRQLDQAAVSEEGGPEADGRVEDLMRRAASALETSDGSLSVALAPFAQGKDAETVRTILGMARGFDAADPDTASFSALAEEWNGDASLATASSRPIGGYRALWSAYLPRLRDARVRIYTEHIVSRIAYGKTGVTIDFSNVDTSIEADAVICTVPVGVLAAESIAFEPALPIDHRDALAKIAMGPVVRFLAVFSEPFWEEAVDGALRDVGFMRMPPGAPFPVIWTTLPVRSTLLVGWAGGSDVAGLLHGDRSDMRRAFFASIDAGFGLEVGRQARELCRWTHVHDWQHDPFARGAYSYLRVDAGDAREQLAEPIAGRLYFAGEACATDGEGGTVAGALWSGEAAARRVLQTRGGP